MGVEQAVRQKGYLCIVYEMQDFGPTGRIQVSWYGQDNDFILSKLQSWMALFFQSLQISK